MLTANWLMSRSDIRRHQDAMKLPPQPACPSLPPAPSGGAVKGWQRHLRMLAYLLQNTAMSRNSSMKLSQFFYPCRCTSKYRYFWVVHKHSTRYNPAITVLWMYDKHQLRADHQAIST